VQGFLLFTLLIALAIGLNQRAYASGDKITQSNDMNNQTAGNVLTGGNDAWGIGFSSPSFGAAISQCVATKASNWFFGAFSKQGVISNYHCMGLAYLRAGMVTAGEFYLCGYTELSELGDACPAAVAEFQRVIAPPPSDDDDGEEEYHAEQMAEQAMMYEDFQAKIRNLEDAYAEASSPPPAQVTREIVEVQQPYLISKELANELKVGVEDE